MNLDIYRFINIYMNVDNARKSYNMERREYVKVGESEPVTETTISLLFL